jgi:hypothetical protein
MVAGTNALALLNIGHQRHIDEINFACLVVFDQTSNRDAIERKGRIDRVGTGRIIVGDAPDLTAGMSGRVNFPQG